MSNIYSSLANVAEAETDVKKKRFIARATKVSNRQQTLVFCVLFFVSLCAQADVPVSPTHEIDHLLMFVEKSPCMLERNGIKYSGRDAAAHIKKKYRYFRNKIKTSEAFIEYSASKSTISGKYYEVHCPGLPRVKTQTWLLDELARYRSR